MLAARTAARATTRSFASGVFPVVSAGINLTGLVNAASILTYAPGGAEARYLSIFAREEMLRVGAAFAEPDLVVMHPAITRFSPRQTLATAGIHLVETMVGAPGRSVWGMQVVLSSQMTSGTGLVLDSQSVVLFSREPANTIVDPYSQSVNNLVRIIVEERLALGVLRPTGICKITYNGTA